MKQIKLTHDKFAIVSCRDYVWLNQWEWSAVRCTSTGAYYAQRAVGRGRDRKIVRMGRFVLGLTSDDRRMADHINGDTLDNRRANLRPATHRQNQQNMKCHRNGKLIGANYYRDSNTWGTTIKGFRNASDAHKAYKMIIQKFFSQE